MLSGEAANSNFSLLFEPMLLHHRCGQLTQWFQSRLKCKLTKEENKGSKMITTRSFASGDHNRNEIFTKDEIITVKSRKINFLQLLNLKVTSLSSLKCNYGSMFDRLPITKLSKYIAAQTSAKVVIRDTTTKHNK